MEILNYDKSTDNKHRWKMNFDGASYEIYIPKWRVPSPMPMRIRVTISENKSLFPGFQTVKEGDLLKSPEIARQPIYASIAYYMEHTKTIRYEPIGVDTKLREIGSPYIPKDLVDKYDDSTLYLKIEFL